MSRDWPLLAVAETADVPAQAVVAIVTPDSAPVRRMISQAARTGTLRDTTGGRPVRAVVICAPDGVHLSAWAPDVLVGRYGRREMVE